VRDKEHRALARAIRKGDRELTDRLLTAHMDDAVRRLTIDDAVDGAEPVAT
jgi:DNA-binding GntR family transcriptional regulator